MINLLKTKIVKQEASLAEAYRRFNSLSKQNELLSINLQKRLKDLDNAYIELRKASIAELEDDAFVEKVVEVELEDFSADIKHYARELSDRAGCHLAVINQRRIKPINLHISLPKSLSKDTDLIVLLKATKERSVKKLKSSKKRHLILSIRKARKKKPGCLLVVLKQR